MPTKHSGDKARSAKPSPVTKPKNHSRDGKRHWIIVMNDREAHIYQKTPAGIERIPEEHLHCTLPLPSNEPDDDLFFQDLAAWLDEAVEEGAFDRLAVIAPPDSLKKFSHMLNQKVHAFICAALAKDVQKITEEEIEDHLASVVWM